MSFKESKTKSGTPRIAKAHTFAAREIPSEDRPQPLNRNSLTQHSTTEPTLPPERLQAERGGHAGNSVLDDPIFGQRYAYGLAEGAALNPLEPWKVAAAVGRDVGQFLLGSVGWKPAQAKVEDDDSRFQHSCCEVMNAKLKKQAEECAEKNKGPQRVHKHSDKPPVKGDMDEPSSKGLKVHHGEPDLEVEYEGSNETTTSISDDEDEEDDEKAKASSSGRDGSSSNKLNRDSVGSSQATGDITVSGNGHYQMHNDAILRLETMTPNEVRFLNIMLWLCIIIAFAFLLYLFIRKIVENSFLMATYDGIIINTTLGSLCLIIITLVLIGHLTRVALTIKYKKVWKPRRLKSVIFVTIELITQWLNVVFFLVPNVESYGPPCFIIKHPKHVSYFALARWTCWNTLFLLSLVQAHNGNLSKAKPLLTSTGGRKSYFSQKPGSVPGRKSLRSQEVRQDLAVMDLPFLHAHWWKLIIWVMMEVVVIADCIYYAQTAGADKQVGYYNPDCNVRTIDCEITRKQIGLTTMMVFFAVLYFVIYCYYIRRALKQLATRSASEFRIANVAVRIQMRIRLPAFAFFTLSILLLWYVRPLTCNSLVDTWFGMLPGQIVMTAAVLLYAFIGTPKLCGGMANQTVLRVWLQEFAWTEEEKPRKMAKRNTSGPPGIEDSDISKEPMFCVETMMKSLYWSLLIYDFNEVDDSKLSLEEGCTLFTPALEHYELFWEKSLDTKMILSWSRHNIVMSFRGTASLANVVADLQAWRMIHAPRRGMWFRRPMVHSGFDKAWRNNGLNRRVLDRLKQIFKDNEVDKDKVKILVTGHSLGGALATLAAYDVRALGKSYGCADIVTCITFGAPRTGNHAFARDLEEMVPDCWHVINDQDVVARGAKFVAMYKRGGHRVLINKLGDLIVRPSAMESSIRLVPCSGSVQQHLLTSYLQSLLAVLLAQFSNKKMKGGMAGVVQLARESVPLKRLLLEEAGLTYDDLVYMMRWGAYAPRVAEIASLNVTVRKKGSLARDTSHPGVGDPKATTRGGFMCGCCAPLALKIKEAKGQPDDEEAADDANIRDGGNVGGSDEPEKPPVETEGPDRV